VNGTFLCLSEVTWVGLQAIIAALAFGGLIWYAIVTTQIRNATIKQSEASRRPYIRAVLVEDISPNTLVLFANEGLGPALSMTVSHESQGLHSNPFYNGSVGVGENFYGAMSHNNMLNYQALQSPVRFVYTDTAKKKYWTTISYREGLFISDTGDVE
jgi:hypothetical protein